MEEKSLFSSYRPATISEGLQNFIDSMMEEIMLEGKPFDSQKKYLKKFCENEEIDYNKLEADIIIFIEILESLKSSFNNLLVKLAEEKARECYVSEKTIKRLVNSSLHQKKNVNGSEKKNNDVKFGAFSQITKRWMLLPSYVRCIVCFLLCIVIGSIIGLICSIIHYYMYGGHNDTLDDEIITIGFGWGFLLGIITVLFYAIKLLRNRSKE